MLSQLNCIVCENTKVYIHVNAYLTEIYCIMSKRNIALGSKIVLYSRTYGKTSARNVLYNQTYVYYRDTDQHAPSLIDVIKTCVVNW